MTLVSGWVLAGGGGKRVVALWSGVELGGVNELMNWFES